jgi:hypothetical protein
MRPPPPRPVPPQELKTWQEIHVELASISVGVVFVFVISIYSVLQHLVYLREDLFSEAPLKQISNSSAYLINKSD